MMSVCVYGRYRWYVKAVLGRGSSARRDFCCFTGLRLRSPPAVVPARRSSFTSRRRRTSATPTSVRERRAPPGAGATAPLTAPTVVKLCAAGVVTRRDGAGSSRSAAVGFTGVVRSVVTVAVSNLMRTSVVRRVRETYWYLCLILRVGRFGIRWSCP